MGGRMAKTILSKELIDRSGASYRQIDYWCRHGIIAPVGNPAPGSGSRKEWDEGLVERCAFLAAMSRLFEHGRGEPIMKAFNTFYDSGAIEITKDLTLILARRIKEDTDE